MAQAWELVVNRSMKPENPSLADDAARSEDAARQPSATNPAPDDSAEIEALSLGTLGRLFGVPFLIISLIVGGAMLVVFMFGAQASPEPRSVNELLSVMESNAGQKSAGVLLPREKEVWQAALELTKRLDKQQAGLSEEELTQVVDRLVALVDVELGALADNGRAPQSGATGESISSRRFEFVLHALGRTERPKAVAKLIEVVKSGREPYVRVAMQELGNLHELPSSRQAVPAIRELIATSHRSETQLTGCVVLSVLADPGDEAVIATLKDLRMANAGEVEWNASLALARLGSSAGKLTLYDLLDREFWNSGKRYQTRDASGNVLSYQMPESRVNAIMVAGLEAAAHLPDPDLWEKIEQLKSDPSPMVRGRAMELLAAREGDAPMSGSEEE